MSKFDLGFVTRNWELFLLLGAVLAALAWDILRRRFSGVPAVSPMELPLLTRDASVIVDVSEPGEFKKGHIPKSVNVPLKRLADENQVLNKHKDKNVIVVCRSGNRSMSAGRQLLKNGFSKVYTLSGGILAWEKEKLPVEKG